MAVIGHGADLCTSATRPTAPSIGSIIYQTDTDEHLKYVTDLDGQNRWMQADHDSNRNLVINGGFNIWQRGTSFNPTSANSLSRNNYGADRWQFLQATTSAAAFTRQAISNSDPHGYNFYTRVQRVAAATLVTPYFMQTSFETQNLRNVRGKYVTLSFWARAGANYSAASSYLTTQIVRGTGLDNTVGNFTSDTPISLIDHVLTTSWKRFTVTTDAVVTTVINQLGIRFAFLPVGTAGANDYFDITGVQLEVGTAPSEFEFEPFETTLRKCMRYFYRNAGGAAYSYIGNGIGNSATMSLTSIPLLVPLRTGTSTVGFSNLRVFEPGGTSYAVSSITVDHISTTFLSLQVTTSTGLTTTRPNIMQNNNNVAGYFEVNAEL